MIEYVPTEPLVPLRMLNGFVSLMVAPMIWRIVWRSQHQHRALYRLGMLSIMAGLIWNAVQVLPIVPVSLEIWMLKDLGIYLAIIAIWLDFRRRGPPA